MNKFLLITAMVLSISNNNAHIFTSQHKRIIRKCLVIETMNILLSMCNAKNSKIKGKFTHRFVHEFRKTGFLRFLSIWYAGNLASDEHENSLFLGSKWIATYILFSIQKIIIAPNQRPPFEFKIKYSKTVHQHNKT